MVHETYTWSDDEEKYVDPKKPPSPRELGGFPHGMSRQTKNSFLSFAAWMGGAEMTIMLCAALIALESPFSSTGEAVQVIYWAGVVGAVLGIIPAALAAWIVFYRKKRRPALWVLGLISMPVTFGSAILALMIIFANIGFC